MLGRIFRPLKFILAVVVSVLIILVGIERLAAYRFGSISNALKYIRGSRCVFSPDVIDVGTVSKRIPQSAVVTAYNLSARRMSVVGVNSSCSCIATEEFPVTLEIGETRQIHLIVRPAASGPFERTITFYTDLPNQATNTVFVKGAGET